MKGADYRKLIHNNTEAAVKDGIAKGEMSFEFALGVLEVEKQYLLDVRAQLMFQQAQAAQPLIQPANGRALPPMNGGGHD